MRNPWDHDEDEDPGAADGSASVARLATVVWLLLGVAVVGLFVGWSLAPREDVGAPSSPEPGVTAPSGMVFETGPDSMTLLLPVAETTFGVVVDLDDPRATLVVAGQSIRVL